MATLTITKTFVNLMSTGQAVSGQTGRGRAEDYEVPGEVRTYAGGRRRAVTSAGERGTYSFRMMLVSRTTVDTLRSWCGQTVQVRDHKGRRFFGVYTKVSVEEIVSRSTWNIAIDLVVVSAAEGI